ncbi:adenylate/guanylate cyclase domain-containing protein [Mesorhizobium australicum]|jgi:adenylate cyclase|uniref:adenylate/guanylate cyclase domain-containing protein n=1 Tax=Mesorhizobium TaxID=68287 RepID=UPI0003CF946A|nr:adenylate/guanylate cyclase domain-containing protein [Mesorhizobium sp. LNHC229A00]ESY93181.1 adenylate cyclase [Mesorhizobium sp. LNHC229A00]
MPTSPTLELRRYSRLKNLRERAERQGAALQFWARTASLAVISCFFSLISRWDASLLFVLAGLVLFQLVGLIQFLLVRRRTGPWWIGYLVGTLDIILLTILLVTPNPFSAEVVPAAMQLREGSFKFLLIFVCLGALTLSTRLALYLGALAALTWAIGVGWVIFHPGTVIPATNLYSLPMTERLRLYLNPNFVDTFAQATNVLVVLIIGAIMALVVSRSRRLSEDYVKAERARANLARHFSPNVVDQLATDDEPFGPVRRQNIAVLFADIVGFTHYSEDHPAEAVFELLRQFHRRMEQVIFDHHGTVDNYIGDCIMATFGVPQASHDDATRAIQCAEAMIAALEDWNVQRVSRGYPPLDVRIGAQYGAVVIGAVGSERNLSFAVVGDTVNVASRLQSLCREVQANICFGSRLIEAAKAESPATQLNARDHGPVSIRGRDEPVHVWVEHRAENQGPVAVSA